jgi:hypothetical protein
MKFERSSDDVGSLWVQGRYYRVATKSYAYLGVLICLAKELATFEEAKQAIREIFRAKPFRKETATDIFRYKAIERIS